MCPWSFADPARRNGAHHVQRGNRSQAACTLGWAGVYAPGHGGNSAPAPATGPDLRAARPRIPGRPPPAPARGHDAVHRGRCLEPGRAPPRRPREGLNALGRGPGDRPRVPRCGRRARRACGHRRRGPHGHGHGRGGGRGARRAGDVVPRGARDGARPRCGAPALGHRAAAQRGPASRRVCGARCDGSGGAAPHRARRVVRDTGRGRDQDRPAALPARAGGLGRRVARGREQGAGAARGPRPRPSRPRGADRPRRRGAAPPRELPA